MTDPILTTYHISGDITYHSFAEIAVSLHFTGKTCKLSDTILIRFEHFTDIGN